MLSVQPEKGGKTMITEVLLDTVEDVLKILPFLFMTYLLLEWLEQKTEHRFQQILEKQQKLEPLYGALLGLFPSCGLSGAAGTLFATGMIQAGTLAAVYLSTSDEMLAIMISSKALPGVYLPILAVKFLVGTGAGYLASLFMKRHGADIGTFCEREHDDHSHGVLYSALQHTLQITAWLFVITLLFNFIIELIGLDHIRYFIEIHANSSVLVSTLAGMIPSCASSIVLTRMYLDGMLSFAAVTAGLLANAGTGMMVLFRVNPNHKENLQIISYVWMVSLVSGYLLQWILG